MDGWGAPRIVAGHGMPCPYVLGGGGFYFFGDYGEFD